MLLWTKSSQSQIPYETEAVVSSAV